MIAGARAGGCGLRVQDESLLLLQVGAETEALGAFVRALDAGRRLFGLPQYPRQRGRSRARVAAREQQRMFLVVHPLADSTDVRCGDRDACEGRLDVTSGNGSSQTDGTISACARASSAAARSGVT